MNKKVKGSLYLLLASACYAVMPVMVRELNKELGPIAQVTLRLSVAFLIGLAVLRKQKHITHISSLTDLCILAIMGIFGYGLAIVLLSIGMIQAPINSTLFLFSVNCIWTSLFAWLFLKEKMQRHTWLALSISIAGILFLFNPANLTANLIGNVFALLSGILTATYYVGSRYLGRTKSSIEITVWSLGFAALSLLPLMLLADMPKQQLSLYTWSIVLLFALDNFLGYTFVNKGFSHINAASGSIILLAEPVLGTMLAYFWYDELPGTLALIGSCLIAASIVVASFPDRRKATDALDTQTGL